MNLLKRFLGNLGTEMDIWFFYGFLLTFPFSIRKVIAFFPIRGQFNEYTGIFLYMSDVFLILALFSWFIILCHKYSLLSIDTLSLIPPSQNVPRGTFDGAVRHKLWTKLYPQFSPGYMLAYLSLILVLWSFISLFWSDNQIISLFRSLKLLEFFLLSIYVAFRVFPQLRHINCSTPDPTENVPRGTLENKITPEMFHVEHSGGGRTFLRDIFKLIILGGVINSILAIWQFITQSSAGLVFLKESLLSPNIDGVAKIVIGGHKFIRAYGFFPHPNVLGGFLLFSIVLTIYYRQMFHPRHNVPRGTLCGTGVEHFKISPFGKGGLGACLSGRQGFEKLLKNQQSSNPSVLRDIPACRQAGPFSKGRVFLFWLLLITQIVALILTFSKSAIIGLIITLLYINVPRGTFNLKMRTKMFHVEHLAKITLTTFFLISLAISIFPSLSLIQIQSLEEREMLSIVPRGTIAHNPILGIGQGQVVWSMRNKSDLLDWQFQPVHNVFLLIWSELGIVGLILFIWILFKLFHVEHSETSPFGKGGLGRFEKLLKNHQPSNPSVLRDIPACRQAGPFSKGGKTIFKGILLGFIFIMLFDHYFWDIQQGQMMLWLVVGLIAGTDLTNKDKGDNISL